MEVILTLDAGGTSTEAVAFPASTDLTKCRSEIPELRETNLPPGNFVIIGEEGIRDIAELALNFAQSAFNSTLINDFRVVAGVAGIETEEMKQRCSDVFKRVGFVNPVILNDCDLLLKAQRDRGVVMIAGTGSNCFGKNDNKLYQDGGWGSVLGDQGSGFQIGQLACYAAIALAARRPKAQETLLLGAILESIEAKDLRQLISVVNSPTKQTSNAVIAAFAPLVFAAAQEGDKVAQDIIATSATQFAELVATVCREIDAYEPCIGQQGGIFSADGYDTFYHPHLVRVLDGYGIYATFKRFGKEPGQIDALLGAARFLFPVTSDKMSQET
jgi:N-acetylglucosamine kinase-like BadF-type ATPase